MRIMVCKNEGDINEKRIKLISYIIMQTLMLLALILITTYQQSIIFQLCFYVFHISIIVFIYLFSTGCAKTNSGRRLNLADN